MNSGQKSPQERNHETYKIDFDNLPFERILEKYRRRRSLEILSRIEIAPTDFVLEIGPGYNPLAFESHPESLISLIEPSPDIYESLVRKYENRENVKVIKDDLHSHISQNTNKAHNLVILSSVFHEIPNPRETLEAITNATSSNGYLFMVVPNNESSHRLFGVQMGVLSSTKSLTTTEVKMQQHTNYSKKSIESLIKEAGYDIVTSLSSFVKPHTHRQMQEWYDEGKLSDVKLEMLYELSEFFDPYNSELFVLARKI